MSSTIGKDRLVQATLQDASTVQYAYDYQNRLVTRSKGGDVRGYVYGDGTQVQEELLNRQRLALYGWGADGLVSRTDANGNSLFYLKDGLGSVVAMVDGRGDIVQSYEYSAFGECLSGKDAVNEFRYVGGAGGRADDATGLVYFWNRWYDPSVGRWASEDPIRQAGGVNLYGYVGNNPALFIDSKGTCLVDEALLDLAKEALLEAAEELAKELGNEAALIALETAMRGEEEPGPPAPPPGMFPNSPVLNPVLPSGPPTRGSVGNPPPNSQWPYGLPTDLGNSLVVQQ